MSAVRKTLAGKIRGNFVASIGSLRVGDAFSVHTRTVKAGVRLALAVDQTVQVFASNGGRVVNVIVFSEQGSKSLVRIV